MGRADRPKRDGVSPSLRFRILQRDGFACHYCGAKPPAALLHVDHILPVVKGGSNEESNLITSCQDCNQGKYATLLDDHGGPFDVKEAHLKTREQAIQVQAYRQELAHYAAARMNLREEMDPVENRLVSLCVELMYIDTRIRFWIRQALANTSLTPDEVEQACHDAAAKGRPTLAGKEAALRDALWRSLNPRPSRKPRN